MNRTGTIDNSLNMRGLQEITPPRLLKLYKQQVPKDGKPSLALLHQAYASCGRVFSCLSLRSVRNGETHINY